LVIVSFNVHISHACVTTGLITEMNNFSFAILDASWIWNIFLFAKETLFPNAILSFISSSTVLSVLSVLTVDPSYLNDLTFSNLLFSIFMGFGWSCLLEHFSYFVLCTFTVRPYCIDSFLTFTNVCIISWAVLDAINISFA
jgi:hypothetical protein